MSAVRAVRHRYRSRRTLITVLKVLLCTVLKAVLKATVLKAASGAAGGWTYVLSREKEFNHKREYLRRLIQSVLYCCAYQSVAIIQSVHRVYREKKNSKLKNGPGGGGLNQRDVLFVVCTAVRLLYDSYDVDVPHLQSWSMLSPCALVL